jgi:hypothetical protein
MTELRLRPNRAITEDDLAQAQPVIRAVVHERLESIWSLCEGEFDGRDGKPDARWAELGLRTLKELRDLYRLGAPQPLTPGEDESTPRDRAIAAVRADMLRLSGHG